MILEWLLIADKTECAGSENSYYDISTVGECSKRCKNQSSMFAYGTNDYGTTRCSSIGCTCLCETAASKDGTCSQTSHNGYRLYKYKTDGNMLFAYFIYIKFIMLQAKKYKTRKKYFFIFRHVNSSTSSNA